MRLLEGRLGRRQVQRDEFDSVDQRLLGSSADYSIYLPVVRKNQNYRHSGDIQGNHRQTSVRVTMATTCLPDLKTRHDDVSKTIRSNMVLILTFAGYSLITLSAPDKALLENDLILKLPIFNAEVPLYYFLITGPIILLALFLYLDAFLNHKEKLEEELRKGDSQSVASSIYKFPAIFNMDQSFAKLAVWVFYLLIVFVLICFAYRAAKMGPSVFGFVAVLTSFSLAVALWKRFGKHHLIRWSSIIIFFLGVIASLYVAQSKEFAYRWHLPQAKLAGENWYGRDLRNVNLENSVLDEAYMSTAILSGAQLFKASLKGTILREAILDRANLEEAKAYGVDLTNASLKGAILKQVDFGVGAKLKNAILHGANLEGAGLRDAQMRAAKLRAEMSWSVMNGVDLSFADAVGAKMVGTKLKGACMVDMSLEEAVLIKANLEHADLTRAGLHKARLHGANLVNAILVEANLSEAHLNNYDASGFPWESHAYGKQLKFLFPERQYEGPTQPADLTGSDLTQTNLRGADMTGAIMTAANLRGADLTDTRGLNCDQMLLAIGDQTTKLPDELEHCAHSIREAWQNRDTSLNSVLKPSSRCTAIAVIPDDGKRIDVYEQLLAYAKDKPFKSSVLEELSQAFSRQDLEMRISRYRRIQKPYHREDRPYDGIENVGELSIKYYGAKRFWKLIQWSNKDIFPEGSSVNTEIPKPIDRDIHVYILEVFWHWPGGRTQTKSEMKKRLEKRVRVRLRYQ